MVGNESPTSRSDHRRGLVLQRKAPRRFERKAEPWVRKSPPVHKAMLRGIPPDQTIDLLQQCGTTVTALRTAFDGGLARTAHPFQRVGVSGEEIVGGARAAFSGDPPRQALSSSRDSQDIRWGLCNRRGHPCGWPASPTQLG